MLSAHYNTKNVDGIIPFFIIRYSVSSESVCTLEALYFHWPWPIAKLNKKNKKLNELNKKS